MENYSVTVSREFGCGAREICQTLAKKLGIAFYDQDLIDLTAQRAGIRKDEIQDMEAVIGQEKAEKLLGQFLYGSTMNFYSDKAIIVQADVIRELAEKGPAIFFGRCSNYFLKEKENCLNIFLYAHLQDRIVHISKEYNLPAQSAAKLINRVDRQRHNYYKYVTGSNRGNRESNNLMIDVGAFGKEGTVDLMADAIDNRFGIYRT